MVNSHCFLLAKYILDTVKYACRDRKNNRYGIISCETFKIDTEGLQIMTEMFTFTAMVQKKEGEWYISSCLELNISSQGRTIEEAVSNLKEAVELHIEREGLALPIKRPFLTTFKVAGKGSEEKKSQ